MQEFIEQQLGVEFGHESFGLGSRMVYISDRCESQG